MKKLNYLIQIHINLNSNFQLENTQFRVLYDFSLISSYIKIEDYFGLNVGFMRSLKVCHFLMSPNWFWFPSDSDRCLSTLSHLISASYKRFRERDGKRIVKCRFGWFRN